MAKVTTNKGPQIDNVEVRQKRSRTSNDLNNVFTIEECALSLGDITNIA